MCGIAGQVGRDPRAIQAHYGAYCAMQQTLARRGPDQLIILSLGMTFVIATGGIDISVGAVVAISAAVCCYMLGGDISGVPQHPFIIAILAALCAGIISGIWNGTLVAKFKIQAMVATLILMTAGRGIAQLITDGQIITVYYKPFSYIGGNIPGVMLPTAMLIALAMVILVIVLDRKTSLGLIHGYSSLYSSLYCLLLYC